MVHTLYLALIFCIALYRRQKKQEPEIIAQQRYDHEMNYLDSIIAHVAYTEGSVSQKRIFELIPAMRTCKRCRHNLERCFELGVLKKELLLEINSQRVVIARCVRRRVEHAAYFNEMGILSVLPAEKIKLTHAACHLFRLKKLSSST